MSQYKPKYNENRTKKKQEEEYTTSKHIKRRVNITIDSSVWDNIDFLEVGSKSKLVEDLLKKELEKNGLKY